MVINNTARLPSKCDTLPERRHPRPSSTPNTNKDGNIKVYKTSGNNFLGYLMLDDGRFGLASRARDALEFDFTVPSGSGVTSGIRIKGGDVCDPCYMMYFIFYLMY